MNWAGPYTELLGGDVYNNGRGRARPSGVPRNSLEAAGYASLDLRASHDLKIGGGRQTARTVTLAVDAFNVLNEVNYGSFVGTSAPRSSANRSQRWPASDSVLRSRQDSATSSCS